VRRAVGCAAGRGGVEEVLVLLSEGLSAEDVCGWDNDTIRLVRSSA
jgi:hypothetical protein